MGREERFTPKPWDFLFDFDGKNPRIEGRRQDEVICRFDELSQQVVDNGHLMAVAPDMYEANEIVLSELDKIIPALLIPCHSCDKLKAAIQPACLPCVGCDSGRAINSARRIQSYLARLQKRARGESEGD